MISKTEKAVLYVKLEKELHHRTKIAAAVKALTLSEIVSQALEHFLPELEPAQDTSPDAQEDH